MKPRMKPTLLTFRVLGEPRPQGSGALIRAKHGGIIKKTPAHAARWRNEVAEAASRAIAEQGWVKADQSALSVSIEFYLRRPKSHPKWRQAEVPWVTTAPDIDKLSRAVLDAMTAAGVFRDDSQVSELRVEKRYADEFDPAGAWVAVVELHDLKRRR